MSFFKRVKTVGASWMNGLVDKAEDPVKMLEQYMIELQKEIAKAEVAVSKQVATTSKIKAQLDDNRQRSEQRLRQAEQAVAGGNDDLARRALADKSTYDANVQTLASTYEQHSQASEQLKGQLREMKQKYQEMQQKKITLQARAEAAKATESLNKTMSGFGTTATASKGFERMEDKVMELEARASASTELAQMDSGVRSIEEELRDLGSPVVEDELASLKAKLRPTPQAEQVVEVVGTTTPEQTGFATQEVDPIEAELAALKNK